MTSLSLLTSCVDCLVLRPDGSITSMSEAVEALSNLACEPSPWDGIKDSVDSVVSTIEDWLRRIDTFLR